MKFEQRMKANYNSILQECLWKEFKDTIVKAASQVLQKPRRKKRKPWFNEECYAMIERKKEARELYLGDKNFLDYYKHVKKEVQKQLNDKKRANASI